MSRVKIDTKETEDLYLIVEVYGQRSRDVARVIGKHSRPVTVLFAFLTLLLGFMAVFLGIETIYGIGIEWFRLPMSTITFLAAIATFSRVVRLSGHISGGGELSAKLSVEKSDE